VAVGLAQEDGRGRVAVGDGFNVHGYSIFPTTTDIIITKENIVKSIHGYILRPRIRDKPFRINDLQ
jgi:hypothetical protein